jgi:hypothetical protein
VPAVDKRESIPELTAMDVGETRAEEIAANDEIGYAALPDGALRVDAVG